MVSCSKDEAVITYPPQQFTLPFTLDSVSSSLQATVGAKTLTVHVELSNSNHAAGKVVIKAQYRGDYQTLSIIVPENTVTVDTVLNTFDHVKNLSIISVN